MFGIYDFPLAFWRASDYYGLHQRAYRRNPMRQTEKTDVICIEKVLRYIALINETYSKFSVRSLENLEDDAICQLAIAQLMTNIHEVQKKIRTETMDKLPLFSALRSRLKAARNIASHDYESVSFEIVYSTTKRLTDVHTIKELEAVKSALG
jgi:uncharacterized protein with HEPN domain